MAVVTAPTTVTLVADTAATVEVSGVWSHLCILPLTASQVVYARGDGTAVLKADSNYACPPTPADPTCVPVATANGTSTTVSLISHTPGDVQVRVCGAGCDCC